MAAVQGTRHQPAAGAVHETRSAQRATWLGILFLLCLLSVGRLLITAFSYGVPAWFDEELNPLINLIVHGQPITQVDARQYGVFVFLVFDPAIRVFGADLPALATYAGLVGLPCVALAFALMGRRFADDDPALWLILLLAWSSAVPLLYVLAQHMVDAWQLLFVSASLYLFTGSARQQRFAGIPLAVATLTKLLPGLLLVYLLVRSWRAAAIGGVAILVLLGIGQVLYGPLMGFGYPLSMLAVGGDTVTRWSTHFENNSMRGLIFKVADGFRLQGDSSTYLLEPSAFPALNLLAYGVSFGMLAFLLVAAWRGRRDDSFERRGIEFSLGLVTMLLISPHTAQDYLVVVLPVLAVWLWLWTRGRPRPWSVGMTVVGAVAAVLIGVFVPMNLAARALPINWLLTLSGNAHNVLFVDQIGSAIGAYDFFGFPGLGLILAWVLLVRLERRSL